MTHVAEHSIVATLALRPPVRLRRAAAARRPHCRDARWPALAAALDALRAGHRNSVRIVDTDCGAGALLLCAVRYARALGFTAIEARGIDDAAALVGRARAAAAALHDPAIGVTFETADVVRALDEEADFPADIVLWHGCAACSAAEAQAISGAAHTCISEPGISEPGIAEPGVAHRGAAA